MAEPSNSSRPARRKRPRTRKRTGGKVIPLAKRSSSHFRPAVRERGAEYLEEGQVDLEVDDTRVRARIEGADGEVSSVGLDWTLVPTKRALHTFCSCPGFASGEKCEHVWATLLALAEYSPESQPAGGDRLSVRKDRAGRWADLGGEAPPATPTPVEGATERARVATTSRVSSRHASTTSWRSQFAALRDGELPVQGRAAAAEPNVYFLVNTSASRANDGLVLDVFNRRTGRVGKPGQYRRLQLDPGQLATLLLPVGPAESNGRSVEIVTTLAAETGGRKGSAKKRSKKAAAGIQRFRLPPELYEPVLMHLAEAGALGWWDGRRPSGGQALSWDRGAPWHLALRLEATTGGAMRLVGSLERNGDSVPLTEPLIILPTGTGTRPLIFFSDSISHLESSGDRRWISLLRDSRKIVIPGKDLDEAFAELFDLPDLPRLEIPEDLNLVEESTEPRPRLVLKKDPVSMLPNAPLLAELSFLYDEFEVNASDGRSVIVDWRAKTLLRRDMEREHQLLVRLLEAGARPLAGGHGEGLELSPQEVPAVAEPLLMEGWDVEFQGVSIRSPQPMSLRIDSGIDWFELSGGLEFDDDEVDLAEVLAAVKKGDRFITLADGSHGLLPAAWSETWDSLTDLSQGSTDEGLRFFSSQALLVDALLIDMPAAAVDKAYAELRDRLRSFEQIKPKKEPRGFNGTLRGYQREGLGWLTFLREYGLGGVLADDMGLGKTVQVLALLRAHRTPSKTTGLPSLVVVPRSLLYNWIDEAARFTPSLKVVEYGGPGREKLQPDFGKYDFVLTTYGTLRRDIGFLATVEFDTIILDEAQAIKNRDSQAAKASRLLVGRNRLALTGTPIENHLGELGSIFEFLNPGFVGRLPMLEILASGRNAGKKDLARLAEGIRPFILRRTKAQVLPDLPPKTEQVLHTTLNDRQRELYDQLRAGYQASLLKQVESEGLSGKSIEVLEALLRLRQIACHPGLVNEEWEGAGSAKLDTLFALVDEVVEEGHKVLVFSQFTKLLGFVRRHFDEKDMNYAYLDGQTRKRGEVVERFQTDPECNIFLVSLKAGGVGLNLTAAGYVFLLDPWWNPAVEAQAIDRTHRIGQTQPVFAYRMIAQDTVEEKILELQDSKRQIAEAVLDGQGGSLKELTADDLRVLLS